MKTKEHKRISKFLSLVLRHQPEVIGLDLNENGWAEVAQLLTKMKLKKHNIDKSVLEEIVLTNDKQRFIFNEDKTKIRANQGHSIKVDLAYKTKEPPEYLYHGTVHKFMNAIRNQGLNKMSRHHVHLSDERATATKVGSRRGKPIVLSIRSGQMFRDGFEFYQSENGVWLTDQVPSKYIE